MPVSEPHLLHDVHGVFFRAVDRDHVGKALSGSANAGRYSGPGQPTLYLSASLAGVEAAMIAHGGHHPSKVILELQVEGSGIFDLRDPAQLAAVRAAAGDPFADWQQIVASGGEPPSWRARDWIERQGAAGLIDASRKAPGLWHLVLFRWNVWGAPSVSLSQGT